MKKKILIIVGIIIFILIAFKGYNFIKGSMFEKIEVEPPEQAKWYNDRMITNSSYIEYPDEFDIVYSTDKLGGEAKKYYSKYIEYTAPNGKPIRILAQDKVSNEQLLYAYSLLSFYLESSHDYDKSDIANTMANNDAVLVMPNGADRDGNTPSQAIIGQPQYELETANPGSKWYIDNDYKHRDSAFEEIFHLVHSTGIGFNESELADPKMSDAIYKGMKNALPESKLDWGKKGLWGLGAKVSLIEWSMEQGSQEAEYIISVIDAYYGLWCAYPEPGAIFGEYACKDRDQVAEKDPLGLAAVESYLPPNITSMMRIDPSFEGTFKTNLDKENPYTYKSRYLLNIRLTGNNNSNIEGNDNDNIFMGNSGTNNIDGKDGRDIVQMMGSSEEYKIIYNNNEVMVIDSIEGRDGKNILTNIECLRFIDNDIEI